MRVTQTGVRNRVRQNCQKPFQEHKEEETPLQVRLKSFSRTLTIIVVSFTTIIFLVGLLLKRDFLDYATDFGLFGYFGNTGRLVDCRYCYFGIGDA